MKRINVLFLLFFCVTFSHAQYTLQDADVEMSNGAITSCSYDFSITDIIIPDTLDGQAVIDIYQYAIFKDKGITSVVFPSTLEKISAAQAFWGNSISTLNLSACPKITELSSQTFKRCNIDSVIFNNCNQLKLIGPSVFAENNIRHLNLSPCTNLEYIGYYAFQNAGLDSLNINACSKLKLLDHNSFSFNNLKNVNLSFNTKLAYINVNVFNDNDITSINLPIPDYPGEINWLDENEQTISTITDFEKEYYINYEYTLQDEDVNVNNGKLIDLTNDYFPYKLITVPNTLNEQTITELQSAYYAYYTALGAHNLREVNLPPTIEIIGDNSLATNKISSFDFSQFSNLKQIGARAFESNNLSGVIDFSANPKLLLINSEAFYNNSITGIKLPDPSGIYPNFIEWQDSEGNSYNAGDTVTNFQLSYSAVIPYTLTDDDVVITENGILESCSYNFELSNITIPDSLDGFLITQIGNSVFYNKGITSIVLPDSIAKINNTAFRNNNISQIDFTQYPKLTCIEDYAFYENKLSYVDLSECDSLYYIGVLSFYKNGIDSINIKGLKKITTIYNSFQNNNLRYFDLNDLPNLINIESYAFNGNNLDSIVFNPKITEIKNNAFMHNNLKKIDFSNCINLCAIKSRAFSNSTQYIDSVIDLSPCTKLTEIGYEAFFDSSPVPGVKLPTPELPQTFFNYWEDEDNNIYQGGDTITNYYPAYNANLSPWYNINFTITDGTNPIEGAKIKLPGIVGVDSTISIANGTASLDSVIAGSYNYTISKEGFWNSTAEITIADTSLNIEVTMIDSTIRTYDANITVNNGVDAIEGAIVNLLGTEYTSDANGLATLPDLLDGDYNFSISATEYLPQNSSITINGSDNSQTITLEEDSIITIPDEAFKTYLLSVADLNNDGEIKTSEAQAFTNKINVANLSINDLSGIEAFINITQLNCSENNLVSLDVSKNILLEELECYNNNLVTLNLSQNTALTKVNVYNNDLHYLNLANGNTAAITYFSATENNLSCISVSDVDFANSNFTGIDSGVSFSLDCGTVPEFYPVIFTVSDANGVYEGAVVSLDGYNDVTTDANGEAEFTAVVVADDIAYTITAQDYTIINRTISVVDQAVQENITIERSAYNVTFTIIDDNNNSLSNVEITLNGYPTVVSDDSGNATVFSVSIADDISYSVQKQDYDEITGTISVVDADVTKDITMSETIMPTYTVTFTIINQVDLPIENANIAFNGTDYTTNNNGQITILNKLAETYNYTITAAGYNDSTASLVLVSDTTLIVNLIQTTYNLSFTVNNGTDVLENASITLENNSTIYTDANGVAEFTNIASGTYEYSISAQGYNDSTATVIVSNSDINTTVTLEETIAQSYTVSFNVINDYGELENAQINFNGTNYMTNVNGIAEIVNIQSGTYHYTISYQGYDNQTGTILVINGDISKDIRFSSTTYSVTFNITNGIDVIENASIEINNNTIITDANGQATITDLITDNYNYTIAADGFSDSTATVTVSDSDVSVNIVLVSSSTSNISVISTVFNVYPNPTSKNITIEGLKTGSTITISNISGQMVLQQTAKSNSEIINMQSFIKGIYVIQANNKTVQIIKK